MKLIRMCTPRSKTKHFHIYRKPFDVDGTLEFMFGLHKQFNKDCNNIYRETLNTNISNHALVSNLHDPAKFNPCAD